MPQRFRPVPRLRATAGVVAALAAWACAQPTTSRPDPSPRGTTRPAEDTSKGPDERFAALGEVPKSDVEPFAFRVFLEHQGAGHYPAARQQLWLWVKSVTQVPGNVGSMYIEPVVTTRPGLFDITAARLGAPFPGRPEWPEQVPEKALRVELETLYLNPEGTCWVRLNFRNRSEIVVLGLDAMLGLRIGGYRIEMCKGAGAPAGDFAVVTVKQDRRRYQCCNLSASADDGGVHAWTRPVIMEGKPTKIAIAGETLLVVTSKEHSFYLRKDNGEQVFYHAGPLEGKDPLADVLDCARRAYPQGGKHASMFEYIRGVALLGDRRGAHFLMECLEKAPGLEEKAMAAAALELLNGNPEPWSPSKPKPGDTWIHRMWERIKDEPARQGEVRRWEKVFGKVETPILLPARPAP